MHPHCRGLLCGAVHSSLSTSQIGKGSLRQRGSGRGGEALKLTLSQSSRSRSTRILISSGIAKEGWVSLSWMATCSGEQAGSQSGLQIKAMVTVLCPFRVPSKSGEWF